MGNGGRGRTGTAVGGGGASRAPGAGAGSSAGLPPRQRAPRRGRRWGAAAGVPFSRPAGVWRRRSGPGPLSKPGSRRCLRLGPGLYLAAWEGGTGAVPGGAAQRPARRSADRALPGPLPRAALPPGGLSLTRTSRRRQESLLPPSLHTLSALDRGTVPITAQSAARSGNAGVRSPGTPGLGWGVPPRGSGDGRGSRGGMPGMGDQGCWGMVEEGCQG